MDAFLRVMGIVFLALLAVLAAAGLWLWRVVRRGKEAAEAMSSVKWPSSRVTLRPLDPAGVTDPRLTAARDALLALGFRDARAHRVMPNDDVTVLSLVHPDLRLLGVAMCHDEAGAWVDISTRDPGGISVTVSSVPTGANLDRPAWERTVSLPGAPAAELVARMETECPPGDRTLPCAADGFAAHFEADYAREMAWRNSRGGLQPGEFQRLAAVAARDLDQKVGAQDLDFALEQSRFFQAVVWARECVQQHKRATRLTGEEWDSIGGFLAVMEPVDRAVFKRYLAEEVCSPLDEAEGGGPAAVDPAAHPTNDHMVMNLNFKLPENKRLTRCGAVTEPVAAVIYSWAKEKDE